MAKEIITLSDLEEFGSELLQNIRTIIIEVKATSSNPQPKEEQTWLKSNQVQRLLGISSGTLQTFRINGTIPYTKVGGVIFYDLKDIKKVMEMNKRNGL